MLMCDLCDEVVPDGLVIEHFLENHRNKIEDWADDHIYEWDGSDPNQDVPTAAERNQGVGW